MDQVLEMPAKKYTQLEITARPQLMKRFKIACETNSTCMDFVISGYIEAYTYSASPNVNYSPHLRTKRQRRAAVVRILEHLEDIRDNEENYKNRMPDSRLDSEEYEQSEQCADILDEAI